MKMRESDKKNENERAIRKMEMRERERTIIKMEMRESESLRVTSEETKGG